MSGQGYMNPHFVSKDDLRRRIAELEAENKKLEWQRDKVARWNGTDISELEELWAERGTE